MRGILAGVFCATIFLCLSLTGAVFGICSANDVQSGWGTATLIETDNLGHAEYPQVGVDGSGNAIAVWRQYDGLVNSIYSNRYIVGTGWGDAELIETDNSGNANKPKICVGDSGNAIAVWRQYDGLVNSIYSNRYVVGTGWGTATLLETDDSGSADDPEVAGDDSGNATAVWHQWDGSLSSIYSNRYVVGTGWGTATLVETDDAGHAFYPRVAADDLGNAIAVWVHSDGTYWNVYSNRYVVGTGWGTVYTVAALISDTIDPPLYHQVDVDASGNATVVWCQLGGTILSIWSRQYVVGTGWGTATLIETDDSGQASSPQVCIDGAGDVTAVWHQSDGTRRNIWSNRYVIGTGWGTATLVETYNSGDAQSPQVSVDSSGNATAVWRQFDGAYWNIYSGKYIIGTGWGTTTLIEIDNAGHANNPQVSVGCSGNAVAVWSQTDGSRINVWSNRYVPPDTTPPSLSVDSPSDGLVTESPTITVSGATEPGVALNVNGISVVVESDGSFSCEIVLAEGSNSITATATDASDNSATVSVSVTYIDPVIGLEEELSDALENLIAVRDELNGTQEELTAVYDDLDAIGTELDAAMNELNATQGELDATQDDLRAIDEELTSTSDNLEDVKSQNLALMAVLAALTILAVVISVMLYNLKKKIADMSVKTFEEEGPPPPQS